MYNKITLMDALYSFWREMGDGYNIEPLRELMNATSYVKDPDFHSRWRNHEIRKFGFADFAQKYMDSTTPIPESEIETAFENYMEIAHELRGMFESGQVYRAWTNALRQLPSVHTFEIGKWNVKKNHKHDWKNHKESDCLPVQQSVEEAVCGTALTSMVSAASQIEELGIKNAADYHHAWADNGTLDALDLSRLHTLKIDMKLSHLLLYGKVTVRFNLAAIALLRKCHSNLRHLRVCSSSGTSIDWPPDNNGYGEAPIVPSLPALESFTTNLGVMLSSFANLLLQYRELKHLELELYDGNLSDWRNFWDAIRNHPSRMLLHLEFLPCDPTEDMQLIHHTGKASLRKWYDDEDNIRYSLENYLSGSGHWDSALTTWFGSRDGESAADGYEEDYEEDEYGLDDDGEGSGGSPDYWGDAN